MNNKYISLQPDKRFTLDLLFPTVTITSKIYFPTANIYIYSLTDSYYTYNLADPCYINKVWQRGTV